MLTFGMHVPLRDRRLRRALGPGALAAGVVAITAPLGGLVVAEPQDRPARAGSRNRDTDRIKAALGRYHRYMYI